MVYIHTPIEYTYSIIILPMVKMNRIAVQAPGAPLQALDAGRVELIVATVARAVKALGGLVCLGK
jgi:hypothetical protein